MKNKFSVIIVILSGMAVMAYITVKATVSSFTHDESFTYLHFISASFMDIISNQGAYSNNHVLNTLGMKYSEMLFGSSEIALRLPNIIMLVIFLLYSFLFFRRSNPVLAVSIFILMATNTALIDFFGLARGYGLSIGFMIMGLYHLNASFERHRVRNLVLFNISAMLAILANFTMLTFYVSGIVVYNLVIFMECRFVSGEKFRFLKVNKAHLILFLLMLIVLYEPVRKAVKFNTFNFGGKAGFVTDTVTSLIFHLLTNMHMGSWGILMMQLAMILVVIGSLTIILVSIVRWKKDFFVRSRSLVLVTLIVLAISMESVIQHWILKTDYLVGRFSLFLVPLFILNTGFLLEYLLGGRYRVPVQAFVVVLAVMSATNFYLNRNLYSCAEWSYDMETKNAVTTLVNHHNAGMVRKDHVKLGINWLFEPTINYYRQTRKIYWLLPVDRNGIKENDDYDYIFTADTATLKRNKRQVIFSSERTGTVLVENGL